MKMRKILSERSSMTSFQTRNIGVNFKLAQMHNPSANSETISSNIHEKASRKVNVSLINRRSFTRSVLRPLKSCSMLLNASLGHGRWRSRSLRMKYRILALIVLILLATFVFREREDETSDQIESVTRHQFHKYFGVGKQSHWGDWKINVESSIDNVNCKVEDYIFGHPVHQSDACLISTFKKKMLIPPPQSQERKLLIRKANVIPSNIEKLRWIEKLLIENTMFSKETLPGFFIECGANDGEFISPTILLEKQYNWTGLLIEANPIPFQSLIKKKRNAWAVNAAACITEHPKLITFYTNPKDTGLSGMNSRAKVGVNVNVTVQCIPLFTMLAALNVYSVDYLSLDVEGQELEILKTIPFDKVTFKVMTIEYVLIPGKQEALREFLEPKGYRFIKEIKDGLTEDCLYVHESLYDLASSINI